MYIQLTKAEKEAIQRAYNNIEDFNGDWSKSIRDKYGITHEQLLDIIDL